MADFAQLLVAHAHTLPPLRAIFGSHGTCTNTLVRKKRRGNPDMRRTYFRTGPLLGTWLPVTVDHVTNVTSGAPIGRILRNSSVHVTRLFWSRDFRLFYLAPPPQIWLELFPYTTFLEELSVEIAPILTILFNKSVTTGIVPSDWRTAHVSPVCKKGQKYNPENYRPISLTCICRKLLEHLIAKHIMSHADTHNILYPLQHGFRTGPSLVLIIKP